MAKKQEEQNSMPQQTEWPIVKNGKFVCSDGKEFTDGYFAREYQKQLTNQ